MAHDDETPETDSAARRGRHLADESAHTDTVHTDTTESPDGEYTATDGVSHTASDEQGSYVDTSVHEEESSEKGSYVDTDTAGADSDIEGEYTDRDE
ncbi:MULTISPECIES: hypothetical protein [unclassified Rathayibacter]|uniref:hypothetical protein n=1 Tax=unclassified Rathayibacter TaxID=2609250 RepID=UPI0006FB996A|nr:MULTISPECIES: hypothetical protein [unclassified Rathayibacter]KQQ05443.1 hypothetical protein ASF42_02330 [Rathayibacter sp. Leaf294]KQS13306.1 hypothetical protein ASG06_02340 [Rathayibacter sp. Leaf185]